MSEDKKNENVVYTDSDHVWIGTRQFISLERFLDATKDAKKSEECGCNIEKKYAVVESNKDYVICHGSGLSWADAHLLVLSQMYEDSQCVEVGQYIEHLTLFELECNEPGLGISYEYNGRRTMYYILDDPGRREYYGAKR